MKLHGLNNLTKPFPVEVGASLHGFRFDGVELSKKDVDRLLALSSLELREYINSLSTKFRIPEA